MNVDDASMEEDNPPLNDIENMNMHANRGMY